MQGENTEIEKYHDRLGEKQEHGASTASRRPMMSTTTTIDSATITTWRSLHLRSRYTSKIGHGSLPPSYPDRRDRF